MRTGESVCCAGRLLATSASPVLTAILRILCLTSFLAAAGGVRAAEPPSSASAVRPASARHASSGTTVVPDRFLRRWDPITFFFARNAGPAAPGPEDRPERWVGLQPAHPGAFTWLDARTLQFRPAEPWPPLARFTCTVEGKTFRLVTLMSPPVETDPPADAQGLGEVEAITLTFVEPVPPEALAQAVTIEILPLPGVGGEGAPILGAQVLGADDFTVKSLERKERSEKASYVLSLAQPLPLGSRVNLRFRLSLDEGAGESMARLSFSTAEPFRALAFGCDTRYPATAGGTRYAPEQAIRCRAEEPAVVVDFSAPPDRLGPVEARNLVRLTPAVGNLRYQIAGNRLTVRGDFARDTRYRVTLAPTPISDRSGRALDLAAANELYLYFPPKTAFLGWSAASGIAERFGPQMVPVSGRGEDRLDLRIFRIDPLDRSFWPFPGQPVVVDEDQRPPGPGEEPEPWTTPDQQIGAEQLGERIAALGQPQVSTLIDLPLTRSGGAAEFGLDLAPHLAAISGAAISGPDQPGTYLVGLRRLGGAAERAWMRLTVTDLALTTVEEPRRAVFAVTSLKTGQPEAGATIQVEGPVRPTGGKAAWEVLWTGTTDAAGRAVWEAPGLDRTRSLQVRRIRVAKDDDLLVLDPADAPDSYADGAWSESEETWLGWALEPLGDRGPRARQLAHLFTERPVYRPEEPVHVKGYLRQRAAGHLAPLSGKGFLVVDGPGDLVWRYPITLSAHGSFYHRFSEQKLPTGVYGASFELPAGKRLGAVSFRMEAYRLPRFEVQLHGPDRATLDRELHVGLTATYYAGGRVAARPVEWRVTQFPYTWTPQQRSGFFYSSDGRFSRTERFESTPALERVDTTDEQGAASLVLNPAIEPTAQPRTYVVEATVVGADDQTVTATRRVVALPPFLLGLKVPRYLERATAIEPEVIAVDADDHLVAGQKITIRLLHRQWHSHLKASDFSDGVARYSTEVVDELVSETEVESTAESLRLSLPIAEAGVYVVELSARDRLGRAQVVAVDLYAGGETAVSWSKPTGAVFTAVADRERYKPGDTATVVLESPFQNGAALAVVEAPEGNRYDWLPVEGGKAAYSVPILGTYTPRLPVHFLLLRGRIDGTQPVPGATTDLGKPATLAATAWLAVDPVAHQLEVKLDYPEKALPGKEVSVEVSLADPAGQPLAGEVTLWLVDQAVLALGQEQRLDPVPDFVTPVASHLEARDTRGLTFGFLPFAALPGGDQAEAEKKGLLDRQTVRRNFQPVPYFNPAIEVDASGKARVTVKLPDDLTNFKLRAKAVSGAERFGYATGHLEVRLPVIVQPALPRFVRPGDRFTAAAIGRVVEGEAGPGRAEARFEGLEVEGAKAQDFSFQPNRPQRLEWAVSVPTPPYDARGRLAYGEVVVRLGVERKADGAGDAFEVRLPVRDDRDRVKRQVLAELEPGRPFALPDSPEAVRPGSLRRTLLLSSQPALVRMAAGLSFLLEYPYGCTEQRVSQARAQLALAKFRDLLHQEGDDEALDRAVADTVAWISQAMEPNGLAAYWPGSEGSVTLTAWVVEFLVEAKAAGYPVDDALLGSLSRALEQALRSDFRGFLEGESWAERTWALAALAASGRFDAAYGAELARRSQYLDLESLAGVVRAFDLAGQRSSPAVDPLVRELWGGVTTRLYQGKEIFGGLADRVTTRNQLILASETRTVAEITRSLARLDGQNPRLPLLGNALVQLGKGDGWGTTNANAAALLALSELLAPPFSGAGVQQVRVRLPGQAREVELGPETPTAYLVTTAPGAAEAATGAGGQAAKVVARAEVSYVPAADGSRAAPRREGFVVSRELLHQGTTPPRRIALAEPGTTVPLLVGDVLEEHIQVVNPEARAYVAVVVPLAAGTEPLNPGLATAPPEARAAGQLTLTPTYTAFLDDRVAFYYNTLPKGTYDFYFRTRATSAGSFIQPGAKAEMMYDGSVVGTSAGARLTIERGKAE